MDRFLEAMGIRGIKTLKGFHNKIFEGIYQEQSIIIRVSSRRSSRQIHDEIQVLNAIKDKVNLAEPLKVDDAYVVAHKGAVIAFFRKVKGLNWHETTLTDKAYYESGKTLGLLHLALKDVSSTHRDGFAQHPDLALIDHLDGDVIVARDALLAEMKGLGASADEFGLVHGDYLYSNLIYQDGNVVIIDFDDIEYNYYLYDVAVYLFYLLLGGRPTQIDIEANILVFNTFMNGYRSVNQTTVLDFNKIHLLFKLRLFKLLATIKQMERHGPWQQAFLELCDEVIHKHKKVVDIDYATLYNTLFDH